MQLRGAIVQGRAKDAIALIKARAWARGTLPGGVTFLAAAAGGGLDRVVDALLDAIPRAERAAAINAVDDEGNASTHWAAGNPEVPEDRRRALYFIWWSGAGMRI